MISHTAIMIADTAMVGRLGPEALAASGFGGVTYFTILSFLMGASGSVQIITSRRFGEKNYLAVGMTGLNSIYLSLFLGGLVSFVGYLMGNPMMDVLADDEEIKVLSGDYLSYRFLGTVLFFFIFSMRGFFDGLGYTYVGMISALITSIVNIFFNWLFIYGNWGFPALGVKGAAIASSASGIPGALVFIFYLFNKNFQHYFRGIHLIPNGKILRELLYIGFAPGVEQFLTNLSFIFFTKFAGMISTITLAASNVVFTTLSLSFMPGFAFGIAATTILGQAAGAKKYRLAYEGTMRSATYSAIIMGFMGFIFIAMGYSIISFFTNDPAVIQEAYPALVIVSLIQIGDAYHMVVGSALRSAGLVYWVASVYVVVSFCVMLPLAYYWGVYLNWGNVGLWSSIFIWLLLLALAFVWKFKKRDWIGLEV